MGRRSSEWLAQSNRPSKRSRVNINRTVNRAILSHQETKWRQIGGAFLSNPAGGTNVEINALSTGGDQSERIGNKVRNTHLTGLLLCRGTGTVRVIIYCPKDPNTSINTTTRFDAIDQDDFWILHDRAYNPGLSFAGNDGFAVNLNHKLNFHTFWGSASSNDFKRNPLKAYIVSDQQNSVTTLCEGHFKVYYKDA